MGLDKCKTQECECPSDVAYLFRCITQDVLQSFFCKSSRLSEAASVFEEFQAQRQLPEWPRFDHSRPAPSSRLGLQGLEIECALLICQVCDGIECRPT